MKKKTKILIAVVIIWTVIVAVDLVATQVGGSPLLSVRLSGGEVMSYIGLGYIITIFYPLAPQGQQSPSYEYFFWPYLVGMVVLIALILCGIMKAKRDAIKK